MRPLDFYIKKIQKQWVCECGESLRSMREVSEHCTEQECMD